MEIRGFFGILFFVGSRHVTWYNKTEIKTIAVALVMMTGVWTGKM